MNTATMTNREMIKEIIRIVTTTTDGFAIEIIYNTVINVTK